MVGSTRAEAFLLNAHISDYKPAHYFNGDPNRRRKLLLHKKEIMRLMGEDKRAGIDPGSSAAVL